jgi:hypothetical protein
LIFKQAVRLENPAFKLTDAIDAAGKTFADPLAPPAHGLFYAPLDAGFLPNGIT